MSPQRPDFVLATHIPHSEADVLVFDGLDVEANCRDRRDDLAQLRGKQASLKCSDVRARSDLCASHHMRTDRRADMSKHAASKVKTHARMQHCPRTLG